MTVVRLAPKPADVMLPFRAGHFMPSRRVFLRFSALPFLLQASPRAQPLHREPLPGVASDGLPGAPTTRPNVGRIDHDRILAAARTAVDRPIAQDRNVEGAAFLHFTLDLPALAAASTIDHESASQYLLKARALIGDWLNSTRTALSSDPSLKSYELLAPRSALAEVAVAIPFLQLPQEELDAASAWFRKALAWLTTDRTALLARDARDHNASAWLLQVSAYAALLGDDAVLAEQRHRFKQTVLRAQITADGLFRNDLAGENPFRTSLYNLDLLAGSTMLLSTRFESLWAYELQDGPGMRAVIARHAAFIAAPTTWPYPADAAHFSDLPGRRPALLFAGRAYSDADYVTLWSTLDPDPKDLAILRAFPIRQPLLWVTQHPAS